MLIKFTLNGDPVEVKLKSGDRLLVDVLREDLQLTGTKHGCGIGACGTCTVHRRRSAGRVLPATRGTRRRRGCAHDRRARRRCSAARRATGLHQQGRLQCGICTPGHVMAACALLEKTPAPTDEQIRTSVESVYCRCTGYVRIEEAYREAVALARKAANA